MKRIVILVSLLFFGCAPSLRELSKEAILKHFQPKGKIIVLATEGDWELVKVDIPQRRDKICILKKGKVVDEFDPHSLEKALHTFRLLIKEG